MAVPSEVWLPIATFVLGSMSQIVGEAIRDLRRCRREDALRDRELAVWHEEQRATARRADLAALKTELLTLNRAVTNPPEEVSPGWLMCLSEARINATILAEAVGDPSLRRLVESILETVDDLTDHSVKGEAARETWQVFDQAYRDTSLAIGKLIRDAA